MVGFDHIILLIIKNYTSNGSTESGAFAVGVCCKILSNTKNIMRSPMQYKIFYSESPSIIQPNCEHARWLI